jgi:NADH-quinone oxidoreductase subunit C
MEIAKFVAEDPAFAMDYLSFVSGVDRLEAKQIEVVYHLFSTSHRHELLLKVRTDRENPRVDSVTRIWAGADWHEREAYDLLGIVFEGHPNLRRIMMTEDWAGHPLRKDYVYEDPQWLADLARQRQREIDGFELGERA